MREIEAPEGAGLYLLCLAEPLAHARHYMGYADNIARRVAEHKAGRSGARIPTAAHRAGIAMRLVRVWPGLTEADEARLKDRRMRKPSPAMRKSQKSGKRGGSVLQYCPDCGPPHRERQAARARERRRERRESDAQD